MARGRVSILLAVYMAYVILLSSLAQSAQGDARKRKSAPDSSRVGDNDRSAELSASKNVRRKSSLLSDALAPAAPRTQLAFGDLARLLRGCERLKREKMSSSLVDSDLHMQTLDAWTIPALRQSAEQRLLVCEIIVRRQVGGLAMLAELLFDVKQMFCCEGNEEMTLMCLAVLHDNVEAIYWLGSLQADPNGHWRRQLTFLQLAVAQGSVATAEALLNVGADPMQAVGDESVLHAAIKEGNAAMVELLLEKAPNVSLLLLVPDAMGQTALGVAVACREQRTSHWTRREGGECRGRDAIIQMLTRVAEKASLSFDGLQSLRRSNNRLFFRLLRQCPAMVDRVYRAEHQIMAHLAAETGDHEMTQCLRAIGLLAPFEATRAGLFPIHIAARAGHDQIVQFYLDLGVERDVLCVHERKTPLLYAMEHGRERVVGLLLKKDRDRPSQTSISDTPLETRHEKRRCHVLES